MTESLLRIGVLLPEVLGTYGDTGNAEILAYRAQKRRIKTEIIHVGLNDPIPTGLDIYTLGGGEDTAQEMAAEKFRTDQGLRHVIDAGKPVLAICASLQVLGQWYEDARGEKVAGMGALDVVTVPQNRRSIGELVTMPEVNGLHQLLTGFENHGGATLLGADARPLGTVLSGHGNGQVNEEIGESLLAQGYVAQVADGVVQGSIIATYMHGPVLARNPELADYLLEQATGEKLLPLEVAHVETMRNQRLEAAGVMPS